MTNSPKLLLMATLLAAGCGEVNVTGPKLPITPYPGPFDGNSADVVSQARDVRDFHSIQLDGVGHLRVEQTGREVLAVSAEERILPMLHTEVRDGNRRELE